MNKIILTGRLTRDPELKETESGNKKCLFSLAVNRIGAKEGQQSTDFFNVTAWNIQAENLVKYQKRGSLILVEGEMRADTYTDEEGNSKTFNNVLVHRIEYLGKSGETKEKTSDNSIEVTENAEDPFKDLGEVVELTDEDLPF